MLRKALEEDGWKVVTEGDGGVDGSDSDSEDDYTSSDDEEGEESDGDIYA